MQSCVQNTDTFITLTQKNEMRKLRYGRIRLMRKKNNYLLVVLNSKTFMFSNKVKGCTIPILR